MNQRADVTGRPLRALAALGVAVSVWIGVRVPAMQRELLALAVLAEPPAVVAQRQVPPVAPLPVVVPPLLTATPPRAVRGGPLLIAARQTAPPAAVPAPAAAVPPLAAAATGPTPAIAMPPTDPAFSLAAQAYDRLRSGKRREAAALFDAALRLQPDNRQWQADRRALGRRWRMGGFALLRDTGALGGQPGSGLPGFTASPVLGGGQVGASIAWLPDPLARRPLALVARTNAAADASGARPETAQLAVGVRQTLLPGISIAIERLVPLGAETSGGFTARLAAGGRWRHLEAYGEAGVIDNGQIYAGGQARARLFHIGPAAVHAASWASVQTGTPNVWRMDVGPSVAMKIKGIRLEADWRFQVGGNASPGSGPVLTVSTGF